MLIIVSLRHGARTSVPADWTVTETEASGTSITTLLLSYNASRSSELIEIIYLPQYQYIFGTKVKYTFLIPVPMYRSAGLLLYSRPKCSSLLHTALQNPIFFKKKKTPSNIKRKYLKKEHIKGPNSKDRHTTMISWWSYSFCSNLHNWNQCVPLKRTCISYTYFIKT